MKRSILRAGSLALALLLGPVSVGAQQGLPIEVQVDLLLVRIERAVMADDHAQTLALIGELRALDTGADAVELFFYEALAAMETADLDRAEAALTRFVTMGGRETEVYPRALEMLLELPELRAREEEDRLRAEAAARAAAEQERRRAEEERRRAQAAERAEAERRARARMIEEERNLRLSPSDMQRIRFTLHQRFVDRWTGPTPGTQLTTADRDLIERAARARGRDGRRHLDRALADELLRGFQPARRNYIAANYDQLERHGDWATYRRRDGACVMELEARLAAPALAAFAMPALVITVLRSDSNDTLRFSFVTPDVFAVNPGGVRMEVPGFGSFPLERSGNDWRPAVPQGGRRTDVTRAMASGSAATEAIVRGGALQGGSAAVFFRVGGMRSAMQRVARLCNRPAILSWVDGGSAASAPAAQAPRAAPGENARAGMRFGAPILQADQCLIVVASRRTLGEVRGFVQGLAPDLRNGARVFESSNGWFAITVGTTRASAAQAYIAAEVGRGRIPSDSLCSNGGSYVGELARTAFR